jgi:hypothetical protein
MKIVAIPYDSRFDCYAGHSDVYGTWVYINGLLVRFFDLQYVGHEDRRMIVECEEDAKRHELWQEAYDREYGIVWRNQQIKDLVI